MRVTADRVLEDAARVALRAPSIHNTQPWQWRVRPGILELHVDPRWQLKLADPDGRLMVLSCGAGLHHARVAIEVAGYRPTVQRIPDPDRPDLLALITPDEVAPPDDRTTRLLEAALRRRTDRRAVRNVPIPQSALDRIRQAATAEGVWLHLLNTDQVRKALVAAEHAESAEYADSGYRQELRAWTSVQTQATAGIPGAVLAPRGRSYPAVGRYAVLFGDSDQPVSWLRAGEALSAMWLTATEEGLAVQPMSSLIEAPAGRAVLHQILSGIGSHLVVHFGAPSDAESGARTGRRLPEESIEVVDEGLPEP